MKNIKFEFKLIIFILLILNISNILTAKSIDKFNNTKDITNYFSGILAINDNQYQKSHNYLKPLNNLENSHYRYAQYFHYSLIALKKFKEAANFSKELEKKKLDNFESNLISGVYYLEDQNFDKAKIYFNKLKKKNSPGSIQNLLSTSLNSWIELRDEEDVSTALSLLDSVPKRFKNIKNIQEAFVHCYFDSNQANEVFKKLTSKTNVNYSRYSFFHANYLISKNNEKKGKEVLQTTLKLFPKNLILNQSKINLEKKKPISAQFNCKNSAHVIAEIFFITANALASKENYFASNFYLNLARYLNPKFVSYDLLYAENFYIMGQFVESKKTYNKIKQQGSIYNWHASKTIASMLIEENKEKEALVYLKNSFDKIKKPSVYQVFDYAEFLKNNRKFKDSIQHYSEVLNLIEKEHKLYSQALDGRGVAYERTKEWSKAEIDLLNSLRAKPNDAYVINYLAYSWIEKGTNIDKSLAMLRKANELKPNDGYITDSLGWALFKLKKYKEAKKYLELAVTYMASDPVINDHYADVLWMNNNSLQARYYWNYVLKLKDSEKKLKEEIKQKLLFGL